MHLGAADLNRFTRWWCAMTLDSCGCDAHPLPFSTMRLSSVIFIWTNRCLLLCLCLHISHSVVCSFFFFPHLYLKLQSITNSCPKSWQFHAEIFASLSAHSSHVSFSLLRRKTLKPESIQSGNSPKVKHWKTWPTTESTFHKWHLFGS